MANGKRVKGMNGVMVTDAQYQIEQQHGKPIRELLVELLNQHGVTETCESLFISEVCLYNWMRHFKIKRTTDTRCECCGQKVAKYN